MTTFQFTFWGCIFGFLLFVAALVVLMMYQVNVWKSAVKAFFRMAFGLTVVGLLVQSALQLNHWAYSLLVALVMVVGVSVFAAHKARIRERRYLLPIAIGLVVSVVPMGLAFAFITLGMLLVDLCLTFRSDSRDHNPLGLPDDLVMHDQAVFGLGRTAYGQLVGDPLAFPVGELHLLTGLQHSSVRHTVLSPRTTRCSLLCVYAIAVGEVPSVYPLLRLNESSFPVIIAHHRLHANQLWPDGESDAASDGVGTPPVVLMGDVELQTEYAAEPFRGESALKIACVDDGARLRVSPGDIGFVSVCFGAFKPAHNRDVVESLWDFFQPMRHEHHGPVSVFPADSGERAKRDFTTTQIKTCCGLVENQQLRISHQRTADEYTCAFPLRQAIHLLAFEIGDVEFGHQLPRLLILLRSIRITPTAQGGRERGDDCVQRVLLRGQFPGERRGAQSDQGTV